LVIEEIIKIPVSAPWQSAGIGPPLVIEEIIKIPVSAPWQSAGTGPKLRKKSHLEA
jgi:hypothetical protein